MLILGLCSPDVLISPINLVTTRYFTFTRCKKDAQVADLDTFLVERFVRLHSTGFMSVCNHQIYNLPFLYDLFCCSHT